MGDGELWSMTTATFFGSKTSVTPIFSSALMASGDVPSWPITKSTSAMTMSPACASVPECAEKIFSAIVFPGKGVSLLVGFDVRGRESAKITLSVDRHCTAS